MTNTETKNNYKIYSASLEDDKEILYFLKNSPSGGLIQLSLDRGPSFFQSLEVEGVSNDTIIGRNLQTGEIMGTGGRSEKKCYINGKDDWIGYLGGLRISPKYRNSLFLWKGYSYLKTLHKKGRAKLYLTTIMADNHLAKKILTSRRTSLPTYHDIGNYHTYVVNSKSFQKMQSYNSQISIKQALEQDIPSILDFFEKTSNSRQFSPLYTKDDILSDTGILRGLNISDFLLAYENEKLVGTIALWDQNKFRRWIIDTYHPFMKIYRPCYNLYARLTSLPILPKAGSILNYKILSLVRIENDREDIWKSILRAVWQYSNNKSNTKLIMAGFHEKDPLLQSFQEFPNWKFVSTLYCVYWEDEKDCFNSLINKIPYVELGSL